MRGVLLLLLIVLQCGHLILGQDQISLSNHSSPEEEYLLKLYQDGKYQQVIAGADSILQLGKAQNPARIHQIKGDALYFINDITSSLDQFLRVIDLSKEVGLDTVYLIEAYSHAGFCYKYLGQFMEAIPYYQQAYSITLAASDSLEMANQLFNLGILYGNLGQYSQASDYLNTAYQIDFQRNDTTALAYDLVSLGDLKVKTEDYETAIKYYRDALKVKETIAGDHTTHVLRLGKLSDAYLKAGALDSAYKYNQLAISGARTLKDTLSMAKQWITKSVLSHKLEKIDSALYYGNLSYNYFDELDAVKFKVAAACALIEALNSSRQYRRANKLLDENIAISGENDLIEDLVILYDLRSRLLESDKQFEEALAATKQFNILKDTLQQRDKERTVLVLDQEYKTAQKEQQIDLLEARNQLAKAEISRRQVIQLSLIVFCLIIVVVSVYIVITQKQKNRLKEHALMGEISELQNQIKKLMSKHGESLVNDIQSLNSDLVEPLSSREFEALKLTIEGKQNKEIADALFISTHTVKFHLRNVYTKLGVNNRKEALEYITKSS